MKLTLREKVMLVVIIVLALALATSLFYIANLIGKEEPKPAQQPQSIQAMRRRIVIWTCWEEGGDAWSALQDVTGSYAKELDVNITIEYVPLDEYKYRLFKSVQHGEGPDVFIAPHEWLLELAKSGLLIPINVTGVEEEFPANILEAVRWEGEIYALPLKIEVPALIVNTELVETPPKTLEDILENRLGVKKGVYPLVYPVDNAFLSSGWFYGLGAYYYDPNTGNTKIDSVEGEKVLQLLIDLANAMPKDVNARTAIKLFAEGKAGMTLGSPWTINMLKNCMKDLSAIEVAPIPSYLGEKARPLMCLEVVYISTLAKKKGLAEEATEIAKHMATKGSLSIADKARVVIAWRKAYEEGPLAQDKILSGFYEQALSAVPAPPTEKISEVLCIVNNYIRLAINGQVPVKEALDKCADEIRALGAS
ncbi:MAG TPA: extracellular solute-binding protein [Candidatus Bathyarchaeota archaeon]|nr:extracellular solute-binding protein [Candidatus Bathyarchaeota archaeon]